MSIAQSIVRGSILIREVCAWIDVDVRDGGYSMSGGMGETYLAMAEGILRELADEIAERRKALLANAPDWLERKAMEGS